MTYSQFTLTFNEDLDVGDKVIVRSSIDGFDNSGTLKEEWVNQRNQSYQVTKGTPTGTAGERSAINYANSFQLDYNGLELYEITQNTNVITVKCRYALQTLSQPFVSDPSLPDGVVLEIDNYEASLFEIISIDYIEANQACAKYKVEITTSEIAETITFGSFSNPTVIEGNTDNPIEIEFLRNQGFTIVLQSDDGQVKTITRTSIQVPNTLVSTSLNINISNSPFGATVTAVILQSESSSLEFSIDNLVWQSSNVFTGIENGDYTMYVRDGLGCSISKSFTVTENNTNTPFSYYSKANSIRMAEVVEFGNCGPYPNDENTLSSKGYAIDSDLAYPEAHSFQTCDSPKCQILSNYENLIVKVLEGENEFQIAVNQLTANIGRTDARDAITVNLGNGLLGIYFTAGNIYDYITNLDTGDDYQLNGGLPEWAVIGNFLSIDTAWFEISNIIYLEEYESEVIVIQASAEIIDQNIIVKSKYNRQDYEVYEFGIPFSSFENKIVQVISEETDSNFQTKKRISELIHIKSFHENHVEVISRNSKNTDIFYASGIQHKSRIHLISKKGIHEDESEINKGDDKSSLTSSNLYEGEEFIFGPVTKEIYRMLLRQLSVDSLLIDGVSYLKNGSIEIEGPLDDSNLYLINATLLRAENGVNVSDAELVSQIQDLEVPNLTITNDGSFISYD